MATFATKRHPFDDVAWSNANSNYQYVLTGFRRITAREYDRWQAQNTPIAAESKFQLYIKKP